jgi:hypothetical protein
MHHATGYIGMFNVTLGALKGRPPMLSVYEIINASSLECCLVVPLQTINEKTPPIKERLFTISSKKLEYYAPALKSLL